MFQNFQYVVAACKNQLVITCCILCKVFAQTQHYNSKAKTFN